MEKYRIYRNILCIDLKSFYASVECVLRGLNPFNAPLVVADKSRSRGSIVLAVTPYLKKRGIKSRCRIYELPKDSKIIFAKPRMKQYLEFSTRVTEVYLKYVSIEDLHIYSIDEAFLDLTTYLSYYGKTDEEMAQIILNDILETTGLYATCGIGPNMLLSKLALDIESKNAPNFLAKWTYDDVKTKLWGIKPLSKIWGIGVKVEKNLNKLGGFSVGDLAQYPITKLRRFYGVIGEELYYHAHGIDMSIISEKTGYNPVNHSVGSSQTLFHDYDDTEIVQIILEMTDDIVKKLRRDGYKAYTVQLGIVYSNHNGGFSRQVTLTFPTVNEAKVYQTCLSLFNEYYDGKSFIRKVSIRLSKLVKEYYLQLNLFRDMNKVDKEYKLYSTIDNIKNRYGKNSVYRASSLLKHATSLSRNNMVGGHNA